MDETSDCAILVDVETATKGIGSTRSQPLRSVRAHLAQGLLGLALNRAIGTIDQPLGVLGQILERLNIDIHIQLHTQAAPFQVSRG
jgi:hypothetical protein